jgi:hypothetical protein
VAARPGWSLNADGDWSHAANWNIPVTFRKHDRHRLRRGWQFIAYQRRERYRRPF